MTDKICLFFATGFGIGYLSSVGQGTLAAFFTLFLVPVFNGSSVSWQLAIVVLGSLGGVAISSRAEHLLGTIDDHRIVIDEIVSIFITFGGITTISFWVLATGFIFNRIFDIWKPSLIGSIQKLPGGWGVMADDVLAGVFANVLLRLVLFFTNSPT